LQEVEILRGITDFKKLKVLGSMTMEKMQETQDLMVKYMDLKNPVPLDQAFTNEFLS
jgi:hypothetical protein